MITPESIDYSSEYFSLDLVQVERSFDDIRLGPSHALTDMESAYLEFQNPQLSSLLVTGTNMLPKQDAMGCVEAALTTHKLIREAGAPDGKLPRLSEGGRVMLINNLITTLEKAQLSYPIPTVAGVVRERFKPELESETSVFNLVKALADHRIDRDAYYAGAATVVAGLRFARTEQSL